MRTVLILLNLTIWAFVQPTDGCTTDYYVNSATGSDIPSCGSLPRSPCKTVKYTLNSYSNGEAVIKTSLGNGYAKAKGRLAPFF